MTFTGRAAYVFPDNFDVDHIIGIPNIGLTDIHEIVQCLMCDLDPDFLGSVQPGDILVAGKSFGYGHAHPQPMAGMRQVGVSCVVAESYLFPFYRSELASGMKLFTCPGVTAHVKKGERISIDADNSVLRCLDTGETLPLKAMTGYPLELMRCGGVVNYLRGQRDGG